MKLAKMLLAAAKVAVLLSGYDDLGATRCRWPGRKATILKACALAERLQPMASITNRCPSTSDLRKDDVDAWNQPFLISCEQGDQITVVVTSMGADGMLGTADDIHRSAETAVDTGTPVERQRDAGHRRDQAAVDGRGLSDDEASLDQQASGTPEATIRYLENTLPKFGWHFAHGPRDAKLVAFVERILDQDHFPMPKHSRFVISKRNGTWGVTVMDLDAFLRGDRVSSKVYRIGYRHGRLELLQIEVG